MTRVAHIQRFRGRGFTLIELVVTISVIVFLVGLTLSIAAAVFENAEIRQTENTIRFLDQAMTEWELVAQRKLSWGDDAAYKVTSSPGAFDLHATTAYDLIISGVLDVIARPPNVKEMLARIDDKYLYRYEAGVLPPWINPNEPEYDQLNMFYIGSLTVLDAWGKPIYATHPGRTHNPVLYEDDVDTDPDPDGTIRTPNEFDFGLAKDQRVCFVSAGPDGQFGDFTPANAGSPEAEEELRFLKDNIYSYRPANPKP